LPPRGPPHQPSGQPSTLTGRGSGDRDSWSPEPPAARIRAASLTRAA